MLEQLQRMVQDRIRAYLREHDIPEPATWRFSKPPGEGTWGISFALFPVAAAEVRAKGLSIPVPQRAQALAEALRPVVEQIPGVRAEAVRGYLNIYLDPHHYGRQVVDAVLTQGEHYGRAPRRGERLMVEFSQPNTHKAFHVGHLRNVILGESICRILDAAGYDVVRANYLGDIGWHVIKWLWNYLKFHPGEEPPEEYKTRWVSDLYVEANRRLKEHPEYEPEVRALFQRWEARDPELVALWEKTRQWSIEGFEQIYRLLDVHFDRVYYESEMEEPGKALVEEKLIPMGIARDYRPEGPVVVPLDELLGLEKPTYRTYVVLRSDGTSLYATKDLPLAIKKFEEYPDLVRSIYVIDVRQSLYMKQIFKTLELMGYPWADRLYHLAYELVLLPANMVQEAEEVELEPDESIAASAAASEGDGGKAPLKAASSREGAVLLDKFFTEAHRRARAIVEEKNPSLPDEVKDQVAWQVALGAVKYTMLARENTRTVTFDWEKALDFKGNAAPTIQYAHVRCASLLRRAGGAIPESVTPTHELHPAEIQLISELAAFPQTVQRAAEEYKPLHITNAAFRLAQAFNDFYDRCPVLSAEDETTRAFRLRLVAATKQTLANALRLLGIEAPEVM
ncbi:MAG: arginine--tRNA ligase [Chloroflexi bacterium]|nr:arginine--tRNA ligase [Chloroflexota bacterium]